jgi:hypothetical protein
VAQVRESQASVWFQGLLQELGAAGLEDFIQLSIYYTGGGSAQAMDTLLLQLAQDVQHGQSAHDFLVGGPTGSKVAAHFGRQASPGRAGVGAGVFGPGALGRSLYRENTRGPQPLSRAAGPTGTRRLGS